MAELVDERDDMDQRLTAAGRRWQGEQPPPPAVPLDRLDDPLPRHRNWRAALAVAAAVVLVGGGAVALSRAMGGDSTAGPSTSVSSPSPHVQRVPQVVPWRDLKAQHPDIGHREHGRTVTPYDNLSANGNIHGHLKPGDVLRFVVTLEAPTDVPLDPCPDYSIAFGSGYHRSWQLNCRQVPFRQSGHLSATRNHPSSGVTRLHGKGWSPLLPARTPIRFEMKVRVPDEPGRQKVLWTLDGPTTMPGFYGIVHVTRP